MNRLTRMFNVFRSKSLEREFEDEIRFHLDQRAAKNLSTGMSPADAIESAMCDSGALRTPRLVCGGPAGWARRR
jgi:hypothetical protein